MENQVIQFLLNGSKCTVDSSLDPNTSLNDYIRNYAKLKGTKVMCQEGGCGACIVSVKITRPHALEEKICSVNSCLVSVFSCHGWAITTIEGLGNRRQGYHTLQSRLAAFNGTQCGACTPGWIMNMYSVWEGAGRKLSMKEVENSFASNICRCTGYRPIVDAFKTLTYDCDKKILERIPDIEDMSGMKLCSKTGEMCTKTCEEYDEDSGFCVVDMEHCFNSNNLIQVKFDNIKWYKVYEIDAIFKILDKVGTDSYMLVAGNTAQGVYHMNDLPSSMIDISSVEDLKKYSLNINVTLGGGMSLNEAMKVFEKVGSSNDYFKYLQQFHRHLDLVAHIPVRNIGTIAGNLMIKHTHPEFPSDVFLLFEAVGAVITLLGSGKSTTEVSLMEFLKTDMKGKIILSINLPPMACECVFQSYKIMPRAQNAHAHVNAAFMLRFNNDRSLIEKASIVYGAISPEFVHAVETEKYLNGQNIFDPAVLKSAIYTLGGELFPEDMPPEPSPKYRKKLAIGLFYKFVLHITPESTLGKRVISGGNELTRPLSSGCQSYDTNKTLWPLNQPIPKLEALVQCSGEGVYIYDIPIQHNEVFLSFVLSDVFNGTIKKFDPSEALKLKGVIAFYTAKDIPGNNTFTPPAMAGYDDREEILAQDKVKYHGQPVAIVVAETERLARRAAKLVNVEYTNVPTTAPVLTVRNALAAPKDQMRVVNNSTTEPTDKGKDVKKVLKGSFEIFGQYHYTFETQSCVCVPIEDGMDVYSSTQTMDYVHAAISGCLKIPLNRINLYIRRLGGAYGAKISRASQIACACAVAAHLLNRPARMVMSIMDNMAAIGKRIPCTSDYEVGVNSSGEIQYLNNTFYQDNGISHNETGANDSATQCASCYNSARWYISANSVLTDTASNTWCRAPGTTEGIGMTENIMEHIAYELGLDPIDVRLANMMKEDNPIPDLITQIKKDSDYDRRLKDVVTFNTNNRWKKRGISLVPLKYILFPVGYFPSHVSIYQADGSVCVSHGGIEMGQGLNTKVAQVCAHVLGVPLESVSIKPTNSIVAPNAGTTGGSVGSELCCYATLKACKILLENLDPIRKTMTDPTWQELISKAYAEGVTLSATYTYSSKDKEIENYFIYCATVTEVEVDILTGNHQVLRVDILEDTGESMSPEVDIGQVEGAFVMGLGYWTTERLVYDKHTGALLTNRTWNYKPPGIKDIPIDFRIQFRQKSGNPLGVLRSKATGEPPLNMAISIAHALRSAISSARQDSGLVKEAWFNIDTPYTAENILLASHTDPQDFVLK